jgi:hypothetical protein
MIYRGHEVRVVPGSGNTMVAYVFSVPPTFKPLSKAFVSVGGDGMCTAAAMAWIDERLAAAEKPAAEPQRLWGNPPEDVSTDEKFRRYKERMFEEVERNRQRRVAMERLGVTEPLSADQIEGAFRERAKEVHPDVGGDAVAFDQVVKARELLLGELE